MADTNSATALSSSAKLTAGTYKVLFVAPGYGMTRSTLTVSAGQAVTKTFAVTPNLASAKNGAKVLGSSAGSLNAAALIDDTEETNWAGVNEADSVDTTSPWVAVDLAGTTARKISSVRVSAMLRPAPPDRPTVCRCWPTPTRTRTPVPGSPPCAASRSRCARRAARPPRPPGSGSTRARPTPSPASHLARSLPT